MKQYVMFLGRRCQYLQDAASTKFDRRIHASAISILTCISLWNLNIDFEVLVEMQKPKNGLDMDEE